MNNIKLSTVYQAIRNLGFTVKAKMVEVEKFPGSMKFHGWELYVESKNKKSGGTYRNVSQKQAALIALAWIVAMANEIKIK